EDGIRDPLVTGVQTCALPISNAGIVAMKVNDEWNVKPAASFHYKHTGRAIFSKHNISAPALESFDVSRGGFIHGSIAHNSLTDQIGRASCRERAYICR